MPKSSEKRQVGTSEGEVEITSEMVKAGAYVLACMDSRVETDEEVVGDIFRAMVAAKARNGEICFA